MLVRSFVSATVDGVVHFIKWFSRAPSPEVLEPSSCLHCQIPQTYITRTLTGTRWCPFSLAWTTCQVTLQLCWWIFEQVWPWIPMHYIPKNINYHAIGRVTISWTLLSTSPWVKPGPLDIHGFGFLQM